jgi:hypothetical protein
MLTKSPKKKILVAEEPLYFGESSEEGSPFIQTQTTILEGGMGSQVSL